MTSSVSAMLVYMRLPRRTEKFPYVQVGLSASHLGLTAGKD